MTVEKLHNTPCHTCNFVAWESCAIKVQVRQRHRSNNNRWA